MAVTREFINPAVSRAGLGRCLRRHGVSDLRNLIVVREGDTAPAKKTFKDYEPGFLHIDIKYLPSEVHVPEHGLWPGGCSWRVLSHTQHAVRDPARPPYARQYCCKYC